MDSHAQIRTQIEAREREVAGALEEALQGSRLTLVKAPPGSGKTHTLIEAVRHAKRRELRIAIGTQTNSQANDVCKRLAEKRVDVVRFVAGGADDPGLGPRVQVVDSTGHLPHGSCIVVATTAKWGMVDIAHPYDALLIDEAWQMSWANLMLLGQISERFVLIGDPGQIPPVVSIDTSRWETAEKPPHAPAPTVVLRDPELRALAKVYELPASRRLPHDSVDLIQPFYDFSFLAWAAPGERAIEIGERASDGIGKALASLSRGSVAMLTLPTDSSGPPLEKDDGIARLAVDVVQRLMKGGAQFREGRKREPLEASEIGISSTHRAMNSAIQLALPARLREGVTVDTPERWQGLQRKLMIAVHPLSGVTRPSEFDLETGRLCVMASRHRGALMILGRDHIGGTLARTVPSAAQPIGKPDIAGRGHAVHTELWERLHRDGQIFPA